MPTTHPFIGGPLDGQTFTSRYTESSIYRDADGRYLPPARGDRHLSRWNRYRAPREGTTGIYLSQGVEYVWRDLTQFS